MYLTLTEPEKGFIRQHAVTMKDPELAEALTRLTGRSFSSEAARYCRVRLGIQKRRGRGMCQVISDSAEVGPRSPRVE